MKIFIKNMVCDRCKLVIKSIFQDLHLSPLSIEMGEVDFGEKILSAAQIREIDKAITPFGFELIDDRKGRLVEKIKNRLSI